MLGIELKIDNYLYLYGTVVQMHHTDFVNRYKENGEYPDFQPIPIDVSWLDDFNLNWDGSIKFSAKFNRPDGLYILSKANGIGIRYNKTDNDYEVWLLNANYEPTFMPKWIKYVHELQNLFYELSEIKLGKLKN